MEYLGNGRVRFTDEEIIKKIKGSANKIGEVYKKDRYEIEQISFGNATAFYCYGKSYPVEVINEKEDIKREVFYYMDDSGLIYKSYVETKGGKYLATDLEYDDEVICQVVGLLPTHNDNSLVQR